MNSYYNEKFLYAYSVKSACSLFLGMVPTFADTSWNNEKPSFIISLF